MNLIELEEKSYLLELLKEHEECEEYEGADETNIPGIRYSYMEIRRELSRREFVNNVLRSHWLEERKLKPCPICGKSWSTRGRGMAYKAAKSHVLKCEG